MNIVSVELEGHDSFYIIPKLSLCSNGYSVYITLRLFNFSMVVKHISSCLKQDCITLSTPTILLSPGLPSYANRVSFEINILGLVYRKGFFRDKNKEVHPAENTPGFVPSEWLHQFNSDDGFMEDLMDELIDIMKRATERLKNKQNDS